MYLMGQAFFSAQLLKRFKPRSIESVAIVTKMTQCCARCLSNMKGMRVVVCPPECWQAKLTAGLSNRE